MNRDCECILTIGRYDGGFIIRIEGHGTMRQSAAFREFVTQCFESQRSLKSQRELNSQGGDVVVDATRCEYLDSTFLGCMIGLHKQALRDGNRFLIVADSRQRTRLFATSVLDKLFEFATQCPEATCEFLQLHTPQLDARQLGMHVMQSHLRLAELGGKDASLFQSIADRLAQELQEGPGAGREAGNT